MRSTGRRARGAVASTALALITSALVLPVPAAVADEPVPAETATYERGRYLVLLRDPSAVQLEAAEGGEPESQPDPATGAPPDEEFDAETPEARAYMAQLQDDQVELARSVGARPSRHFTMAANGFSAYLTARQAAKLSVDRDVLLVQKDERRSLDTSSTPGFLGLGGRQGAWAREAGGRGQAGDGVVIGVLDSGIWPEAPSFAGEALTTSPRGPWGLFRDGEQIQMTKADGEVFRGRCQLTHEENGVPTAAMAWAADSCNSKIVGARYYPEEYLAAVSPADRAPTESLSARDGVGHGTHTASTAAGNRVNDVVVEGVRFGAISGMAPAAKIASYKVCFADNDPRTGDCFTGAILAAIEDAISDGVDVLNFSISGSRSSVLDAVELGFAAAAEAGIFVAASAGNAGPDYYTVSHNSPWLTTVAATTHRRFENTVVLGDGTKLRGASIAQRGLPSGKLVDSAGVPTAGATAAEARVCSPGSLDERKVAGAIVVCSRGEVDRVAKSAAVKAAGGIGMLLVNQGPDSLDADFHAVPTIHLADTDGAVVSDYLTRAGEAATAAFKKGDRTGARPTPVPTVAGFSARGPAIATGGDLLKPDIAAPGAAVLAAVSPQPGSGRSFDLLSGTSMAAPHIAGLAAFLMAEHPSWSPMHVKSAMMTTARSVRTLQGGSERDPFSQGAGLVRPSHFSDPGLFVTSSSADWQRFVQGQGLDLGLDPLAAKDLNVPSLAHAEVTATTTFTRRFEASRAGVWKVKVQVPGFRAEVPGRFVTKRAGQRKNLKVTLVRTTAPLGQYATGFLVLRGPSKLRLPIAVRPVAAAAPSEVTESGTDGAARVPVDAGVTGELRIGHVGLAEGTMFEGSAATVSTDSSDAVRHCVRVAEGSKVARFEVHGADGADVDLFVHQASDSTCSTRVAFAGESASRAAHERVTIFDPVPSHYLVEIDPYSAGRGGAGAAWRLDFYDVNPGSERGGLRVTPNPLPVVAGRASAYVATWSRLSYDRRYLGMITYEGALSPTLLTVHGTSDSRSFD